MVSIDTVMEFANELIEKYNSTFHDHCSAELHREHGLSGQVVIRNTMFTGVFIRKTIKMCDEAGIHFYIDDRGIVLYPGW